MSPRRGEIWWGEAAEEGGRPFLVISRSVAIEAMQRVLVVPITRTQRRTIRSELTLGPGEGLRWECCAAFDNIRPFPKSLLIRKLGGLSLEREHELCAVLAATTGC